MRIPNYRGIDGGIENAIKDGILGKNLVSEGITRSIPNSSAPPIPTDMHRLHINMRTRAHDMDKIKKALAGRL